MKDKGINPMCQWCNSEEERSDRLFWKCTLARSVWDFISEWWNVKNIREDMVSFSLERIFEVLKDGKEKEI